MLRKIAVIGLGYVGLSGALASAEAFPGTVGFDIAPRRIEALRGGKDTTGEVEHDRLKACGLIVTDQVADLEGCDTFIVCVPTPIHKDRRPNLDPLRSASETVGKVMKTGAL